MTKPIMHFSHGNSYPAGTYSKFFEQLDGEFDIRTVDRYGHHPDFPVTDGWPKLVEELIARVEAYGEPVILLGHSLGGMLSLMAARQRPDLARCVVMLDSPVVAGWRALLLRFAKVQGWQDRFSPSRFSVRRRNVWPDAEAAYRHFAGKEMFAAWAPGVLADYLEYGLEPHPEGVQLRFSREIETEIYRSLPHHLDKVVDGQYPVPVGFIGGTESVELKQAGLAATRRLVGENFAEIQGAGHLFPMEQPVLAARLTREMVARLLRQG
jgi:pimeloyl-ACP methyl ester carboxylesterase